MTDTPILTAAQALEAEFRGSEDAQLSAFGHLRLASADASHFLHMDSDDADAILDWCERALAARIPPLSENEIDVTSDWLRTLAHDAEADEKSYDAREFRFAADNLTRLSRELAAMKARAEAAEDRNAEWADRAEAAEARAAALEAQMAGTREAALREAAEACRNRRFGHSAEQVVLALIPAPQPEAGDKAARVPDGIEPWMLADGLKGMATAFNAELTTYQRLVLKHSETALRALVEVK